METSVKAAKVSVPPQPDVVSSTPDKESTEGEVAAAACGSSSDVFDPMEEFSRRLEDIISAHGSAATLVDKQSAEEAEVEKMKEEAKDDSTVTMETVLPRLSVLLEERQQLQAEHRSSITARSKLETLCRELQGHYRILREETLQRCREDEEKRTEITSHFQKTLTEIQAQIEQHSARNDKLCHENTNLTDKLESLMNQCEQREASLEKINRHRDLQHKLTEAKLQQANALLAEAEEKHKREKEYLLRETIDKTKKCFAMKEQELAMKKKLTLYAQKFDEFQVTLSKSNEIYVRFKTEMENMSDKMKKLEKESNLWRMRFENCNKALTDMIEERTEKSKEYELFVLKIQKLEKLCRALQDERKVLYDKIKEVRQANSNLPSKIFGSSKLNDDSEGADKPELLTPVEIQKLQEEDLVLTEDMARLREQQAKLQVFADSLLAPVADNEEEDKNEIDLEEDLVASAFIQFKTKTHVKEELVPVPEEHVVDVKSEVAETSLPQKEKAKEVQKPALLTPEKKTSEMIPTEPKPEAVKVHPQVEVQEVQQVKSDEIQQQPAEQEPTHEAEKVKIDPPTDLKPEPVHVQIQIEDQEVQQVKPNEEIQQQPAEQEPTHEAEKVKIDPPRDLKPEPVNVQTQIEDKEVQQVKPNEEIQQLQLQQQPPEQHPAPETEKVNPPTDAQPEAPEAKILEETGEVKLVVTEEDEKVQQHLTEPLEVATEAPTTSESASPSEKTAESSTKQVPKKKKKKGGKNAS